MPPNNPNFTPGRGRIAADLYDFKDHTDGYDFNHSASDIEVDNPGSLFGNPNTVQDALVNLSTYVSSDIKQAFLTLGDGYDTWHNADGTNNYDAAVPSLDTLLNPIFTAIRNNTALPTAYQRIKRGGTIVLKAGTYIVKNTIVVPPGITIMGEGFGTKIINATSMDFAYYPPRIKNVKTPGCVFRAQCDPNRGNTSDLQNAGTTQDFMFVRATKFVDLVIADNFVQEPVLGDLYYKLPQNTDVDVENNCLIGVEFQSNVELHGVYLVGKTIYSGGTSVSSSTYYGVGFVAMTNGTPDYNQTNLKINNCFIDNVRCAGNFNGQYGYKDIVEIENSKIRGMAATNGNFSNNNVFNVADINFKLVNNVVVINNVFSVACLVYMGLMNQISPTKKAQWLITGNQLSGTTSQAVYLLGISGTYTTTVYNNINILTSDNNLVKQNSLESFGYSGIATPSIRTLEATTYTLDSTTNGTGSLVRDHIILVNTVGAKTITIPNTSEFFGRNITIKDIAGNAGTGYPINIVCSGTSTIDGVGTYTINQSYGSVDLIFSSVGGIGRWNIV